MIRRPPRSTQSRSSAASDVYKRQEMARVLKPGGTLIVNVAALDILRGGHAVLAEELRRYDRRMLTDAVAEAGLRTIRLTYTNASLSVSYTHLTLPTIYSV